MNELTKFLVEGILNETTEKVVALFGGGFKPPTKGHLDVVNQGINQNPEVSEVKILVGGKERNGFTQDQAVKIWNLYNDVGFINKPATIIPVSSPFTYYKNYLKDNPDDKVYIFIGSREGDKDDKFDVKQRSEFVKKYSDNVIPVEVATTGGVSGTLARKLFKTDIDGFRNMFPENLLDQDFQKILDILNNKSTGNAQKSAPKSTEPLTPQNENLILERIKFSPDEIKNIDEVLRRAKEIFKKGISGWRKKERFEGVATMPFTSADGKEGKVNFYIDHLMSDGTLGRYNRKKENYLKDDMIYLNGPFFTSAYAAVIPAVFNKVTGGNPDQYLLDTIKHELIHAKDPGRNQGYLKEPYNARDPKLYYGTWTEFPAQTGEFLEAISQHAEEKLRNNPNDKEIKIFERILQNILDVYAGKQKEFYNQTVDFIAGGSKKNVVQSFIKDIINIGGEIANINTVPEWDSMSTFDRYYKKIQLIKKYNPEGYKKFLNDLYKEVKNIEEMTNFYLRERAKALGQTEYNQIYVGGTGKLNEGDPKKGTGKKPKGSGRRLYTDEDPSDTVGVKFSTRQDIVDTLNKKSFKAKSHARQSQIINLIHQRVRAALSRTKDPAKKKKLKSGFEYIKGKKEASKKKTQRLKKQKLKENQMSMEDFNLVGAVLRDKNKAEEIHNLLLQMFPKQKELLDYNYKNDSYAEFKRVIFHIDKYKIEGPKTVQHTKLKLDPEVYKERDRKYEEYAEGKIKKYFRDSDSDPRKLDLTKLPPITIDSGGEVMDGNHRAFLAIKQQKPLKAYQIIDAKNDHPNVEKILNIVGRKKQEENIDPTSQKRHKGKSAPFGSAYEPVDEIGVGRGVQGSRYRAIEKRGDKYYYIQDNPFSPGVRQEFGPYKTKAAAKRKMGTFPPAQNYRDITEIGIDLTNYDGQILPGDVLRAPKGFPLGGKKLESSKQLKVIKNSREGVNRYKLSLEDKDGKKYSVRNFEMDGEYKGKKLPKWGLVRKSKKNINEIDYDSIFRTEAYIKTNLSDRDQGDILSDIRSLPGVTIVGSKDVPNRPSKEESILSIKVDPYPFTKMDDVSAPEAVDYISSEIRKINGVERFQILKKRVSEGDTYEKMAAKGKKAGSLKQGTVRKRLKIPKDKKIPLSLINKELSRLKKMDKDKDKKGVQLGDKNQKYYKALQLSKTLKTTTNVNESEDKKYYNFQIRIKNDSYDNSGTTFSNMGGRIQKSSTSKDGNPLIFNYKNVPSLVKAAFKTKNDNSEILIYNDEGKGKVYPLTIQNVKLIKRPTSLNEELIEENLADLKNWGKTTLKKLGVKSWEAITKFGEIVAKIFDIETRKRPRWSMDWIDILRQIEDYNESVGANWPYDDDDNYGLAIRLAGENDKLREKLLRQGKITQKDIDYWRNLYHDRYGYREELTPTPSDRNIGMSPDTITAKGSPLYQIDGPSGVEDMFNRDVFGLRESMFTIAENATYSSKIDYKQQIKDLTKHMIKKGMNILPLPRVIFKHGDQENASQFLGKTAYYSPSDMTVVLYTEGRHPKDIVRSFAHEMIHHIQNLEDRLHDISTTNTMEDDHLNNIEREAYTRGNMVFRNWTDNMDGEEVSSLNEKKKDPFGLNQYARELVKEFQIEDIKPVAKSVEKPKEVRIFNKDCGCDKA